VTPGTVLGHEAVGIVVATGSAVTTLAEGDRVLVPCISSYGRCHFCKGARYGRCVGGGGWVLGHTTDGVQAELARIPFADTSLYKVPEQLSDEQVLFLADILPTAYEVGVLDSNVTPGDTIAIVGAGPAAPAGRALVRDQHPQMLECSPHGYRNAQIVERSIRSPITLVRSSIASIASAGTRRRRQRRMLKRTDSTSGAGGDPPSIRPSSRARRSQG
jgi:alcohol dehydrogenase-like protein